MIDVQGLRKRFSAGPWTRRPPVEALRGVDFRAADGVITGLLGPNGAGKTTALRIVAGLLRGDGGSARVDGMAVDSEPLLVQARLGVLSDARGLSPRLTARENIVYFGQLQGLSRAQAARRADVLARSLELEALLERRVEGFSQGERMKTALARALVHDPPNIILDEPTNGLDVQATRSLRAVLRRMRDDEGKCIVFSSHIMQEVERLCDHVVVIAHGRTVAAGSVDDLRRRTGDGDFEDAFVRLAFGADGGGDGGPR